MQNIFFTSDTHFFHDKPFIYQSRGFQSVEEMNEVLVERWNRVVKPYDTVYHLGDVMLGKDCDPSILCRLNGEKILIQGNHDSQKKLALLASADPKLRFRGGGMFLPYNKHFSFFLCHYPTLTANGGYHKMINLHGHTHQKEEDAINSHMLHVGVDSNDLTPISLEDIVWRTSSKEFDK